MQLTKTPILGLSLIHAQVIEDLRGYFWETYQAVKLAQAGIHHGFIQENESYSRQGTIRGLHYQLPPYAQAKLIRVIVGEIWDVAVDLRKGSPTFGQWEGIILSAVNKKQLLVPKGYAHGFAVLSKEANVIYKCDAVYQPAFEAGIYFMDPTLNIDWKLSRDQVILSKRDEQLPSFDHETINFTIG